MYEAKLTAEERTDMARYGLARANAVRCAKAALRKQVVTGEINIIDVILDPPAYIKKIPTAKVLMWAPGMGHHRTRLVMRALVMDASTPFGALTIDRRRLLVERLLARPGPSGR